MRWKKKNRFKYTIIKDFTWPGFPNRALQSPSLLLGFLFCQSLRFFKADVFILYFCILNLTYFFKHFCVSLLFYPFILSIYFTELWITLVNFCSFMCYVNKLAVTLTLRLQVNFWFLEFIKVRGHFTANRLRFDAFSLDKI